jgi:hypothetical protein
MQIDPNSKPNVAIFLDIDGVFNTGYTDLDRVDAIIKEETGNDHHTLKCDNCVTCYEAMTRLFDLTAINTFQKLVDRIKLLASVHIVISSNWRLSHTVDNLKKILGRYEFSQYIIDKTSEMSIIGLSSQENHAIFDLCIHQHIPASLKGRIIPNPHFPVCRAIQINEWLKNNPRFKSYLVIDDLDDWRCHLSTNFGNRFIHTYHEGKYLFRLEDACRAYEVLLEDLGLKERDEKGERNSEDSILCAIQ